MPSNKSTEDTSAADLSLYQMLEPYVLGNPYPLYAKLRSQVPVHWDPFLHSWVVTGYADCVKVLTRCKASRTPTPEHLKQMGLEPLAPYAAVMLDQMMFTDAPDHTRLRALCAVAFTPRRIENLKFEIGKIAAHLIDQLYDKAEIDLIRDFAGPFPAIVTTTLLGVPTQDALKLKRLSASFAELMGNFDHDPDDLRKSIQSLIELQRYFEAAIEEQRTQPGDGLISTLISAEVEGGRLTDREIVANVILVLVGGLEETTNLIGNGMWILLRSPDVFSKLLNEPELIPQTVEEILRYEPPTQFTARIAAEDMELGGKRIVKGDSITVVLAAANRDPAQFEDAERFQIGRKENRHLAFGWASHYCFGAPMSRMCGQVALKLLLERLPGLTLKTLEPVWRQNIAMHGLSALKVEYDRKASLPVGQGNVE